MTENFLLVYSRYGQWHFESFSGFEEAARSAVQGEDAEHFSSVAIADRISKTFKLVSSYPSEKMESKCKEFLLEKAGCSFAAAGRLDLIDFWEDLLEEE